MQANLLGGHRSGEITRVVADLAIREDANKIGVFKFLEWESEEAMFAAAGLLINTAPDRRDDDFWSRYYGYCKEVHVNRNVGMTAGLHVLLQAAADLSLGTAAKFGGPAGSTNKTFIGVGNGLCYATLSAGVSAGATTATIGAFTAGTTSGSPYNTLSAGDVVVLEDSTTLQAQGTNVEVAVVLTYAAGTITFTAPLRFAHASGSYVVRAGGPGNSDMGGTSRTYKGIEAAFPTEGLVNSKATLTWQANYGTAEAQYAWNEACIGAVPAANTPPNAGSGSTGVTTLPTSAILLAASVWYPSPLTKGAAVISAQYQFSIS